MNPQRPSLPVVVRNSLTSPRSPHPLSDTTCTTTTTTTTIDDDETIVAMLAPVAAKNKSKNNSKNDVLAKTVVDDDAGINENENENDDESSIEDDLDFINQMYGSGSSSSSSSNSNDEEEEELKGDDTFAAPTPASTITTAIPTPPSRSPPPTTTRRKSQNSTSLSGQKYDYNPTRIPRRSSLKQPPGNNNNYNDTTTSSSSSSSSRGRSSIAFSTTNDIKRKVVRHNSADGIDKRRGSLLGGGRGGTVHSVRMRGSVYPVQRRRSIEFEECVKIQEVRRMTELNVQDDTTIVNHRDLWIQPDEVAEMKDRRRTLLKKYKEREELRKEQQKRIELQEKVEKKIQQQEQRVKKNQKMKQKLLNININGKHIFKNNKLLSTTRGRKERRSMSPKKNVDTNGGNKKAGRRLSLTNFKISSPKRKELHKQLLLSSKSSPPPPPPPMPPPMPSNTNTQNSNSPLPIARGSSSSSTSSFVSINSGSFSGSFSGTNSDADSFRGLEKYVDRSGRHQKHMAWDTVLIEQDEQEHFGYYDDERIAKLYQDCQNEHNGQQKVLDRAEKDRQFANDYLLTPRTMKLVKKSIPTTMQRQMQMITANIDLNNSCHSINSIQQQPLKEEEEEEEESGGGDGDDATTNEIQHKNEKSVVEQHSPAPEDSGYRRYARRLSC